MTNTVIEEDLKTLIDASDWTVGGEEVTKDTYVYEVSHSKILDLDQPEIVSPNVVFVIKPAVRSLLSKSMGATTYQFNGVLRVNGESYDDVKAAMEAMKPIADSDLNLSMFFPGTTGDPVSEMFFANIVYQWNIFESD